MDTDRHGFFLTVHYQCPSVFILLIQRSVSAFIGGSALIVFFFLYVRTAFSTGKSAPHPFGSLIQAIVVIRAGEIAYTLALLAHHGIGSVLIHSFGLNELSSRTFFLRHEYKLLITPRPEAARGKKCKFSVDRLFFSNPIIIFYVRNLTSLTFLI